MDIRLLFWIFWMCQFYMLKPGSGITSAGLKWVKVEQKSVVPPNAVVGGHDMDGAVIYVGGAWHDGFYLTANVIPSKKYAYVGWVGRTIAKTEYDVLTGSNFKWVPMKKGSVPMNAVIGGNISYGDVYFIGRANWQGSLIVGKIVPSHHVMYFPVGGEDPPIEEYEALIHDNPQDDLKWVKVEHKSVVPPNAVVGGHDMDGAVIYVGGAWHDGFYLTANVIPSKKYAYVGWGGRTIAKTEYDVLTGSNFKWVPFFGKGSVPMNAVIGGNSSNGEVYFVGRANWKGSLIVGKIVPSHHVMYFAVGGEDPPIEEYETLIHDIPQDDLKWVKVEQKSVVPPNAVVGGHDMDGAVIYVGGAWHDGFYLTANVIPSKNYAYVGWGGRTIAKTEYDVLTGSNFKWVPFFGKGSVPMNAVIGGNSSNGEVYFVGRANWKGSLIVGKIVPSHHVMYFAVGGEDPPIEEYETLIHDIPQDDLKWVKVEQKSVVPPNAVVGGHDMDGAVIYVGGAWHDGFYLTANVIPSKNYAYVGWGGRTIAKTEYDVLTGSNFKWVPFFGKGSVPMNAVIGGNSSNGEVYFVGRANWKGSLIVGKIVPSHHVMYFAVGGEDPPIEEYETLIHDIPQDDLKWVKVEQKSVVPPNAVVGGHDMDGAVIYVGGAWHDGFYLTANVIPSKKYAYVGSGGRTIAKTEYDVLTGSNFKWVPMKKGSVPMNAVIGGNISYGDVYFIGRANWQGSLIVGKIVPANHVMYFPVGGEDPPIEEYEALTYDIPQDDTQPPSNNSTWLSGERGSVPKNAVIFEQHPRSYIGRAVHNGELLPALVVTPNTTAYVWSTDGEVEKPTFEVLSDDVEYCWEFADRGYVPPCAVEVGRSAQGEPLYIGRTANLGNMIMGKIQPSHGCMYISVDCEQLPVKYYEVLVYKNYNSIQVE